MWTYPDACSCEQCEHTFGLQALAPPLRWSRARLGLQERSRDEWNDEALKLLSGISLLWSPRGTEQPGHTQTQELSHSQSLHTIWLKLSVHLTVEITSQQLHSNSGLLRIVVWMDTDVASHEWRRELVFSYPGAVHVATKDLQETHNPDFMNELGNLTSFSTTKHALKLHYVVI